MSVLPLSVVSYRNSTSNHNWGLARKSERAVVSYRNSTSNHNSDDVGEDCVKLYLIEILHQTTTKYAASLIQVLVVSYRNSTSNHNNVLYNTIRSAVVSYRNSTSNHNSLIGRRKFLSLYLIEILHQTTTGGRVGSSSRSCILSKFYIKPQHEGCPDELGQSCILSKFYIKPQRQTSTR